MTSKKQIEKMFAEMGLGLTQDREYFSRLRSFAEESPDQPTELVLYKLGTTTELGKEDESA